MTLQTCLDCYGLFKALSCYQPLIKGDPPVLDTMIGNQMNFTVLSTDGRTVRYILQDSTLQMCLVSGPAYSTHDQKYYLPRCSDDCPPDQLLMTACWLMVRRFWPEEYRVFALANPLVNEYSVDMLRLLLRISRYNDRVHDLYLAIFAILATDLDEDSFDGSTNVLMFGGERLVLVHEESDLTLHRRVDEDWEKTGLPPDICSWMWGGRNLWRRLLEYNEEVDTSDEAEEAE